MMTTAVLYGFKGSTFVQTVLLLLEEQGLDYELRGLEFGSDTHRALHPFAKLPAALEHGEMRLFETLAICHYINHVLAERPLTPRDPSEQARMVQWVSVAMDYGYAHCVKALVKAGDDAGPTEFESATACLDVISRGINRHGVFAADQVSLADLFIYPIVRYCEKHAPLAGHMETLAPLCEWRDRMTRRDATVAVYQS